MATEELQETVSETTARQRLDVFVAARLEDGSRADAQQLIESGLVTVDGKTRKSSYKLRAGEIVLWQEPEPHAADLVPEPLGLAIVHADPAIIIINKPAGLVVHPGCGCRSGTLAAGLLFHFPELAGVGGPGRPGIVHRLDKDTSGVMVVARTEKAYHALTKQFAARTVRKRYLAVCRGVPRADRLTIDLPIGRSSNDRKKMTVRRDASREAQTELEVLDRGPGFTLVALSPRTGRTHQLRVHLAYLGHPLAGDPIYGGRPTKRQARGDDAARLLLHAETLSFIHPATGEPAGFRVPPPPDFVSEWERLRGATPAP